MATTFPTNGTEQQRQQYFIEKSGIVGQTIKTVRYMTADEAEAQGWSGKPVVIELANGTLMYPMQDDEGNGPGAINIQKKNSNTDDGFPVF